MLRNADLMSYINLVPHLRSAEAGVGGTRVSRVQRHEICLIRPIGQANGGNADGLARSVCMYYVKQSAPGRPRKPSCTEYRCVRLCASVGTVTDMDDLIGPTDQVCMYSWPVCVILYTSYRLLNRHAATHRIDFAFSPSIEEISLQHTIRS